MTGRLAGIEGLLGRWLRGFKGAPFSVHVDGPMGLPLSRLGVAKVDMMDPVYSGLPWPPRTVQFGHIGEAPQDEARFCLTGIATRNYSHVVEPEAAAVSEVVLAEPPCRLPFLF